MSDAFAVILPAAGRSVRFGGGRSKLLAPLAGRPVLWHSVDAFLQRSDVAALIIAAASDDFSELAGAIGEQVDDERLRFCCGGDCRAQSVRNALQLVPPNVRWTAIHDAARPLVSQELIDRTFAAARQYGAAVPALPVALTIKQAAGPLPAKVQRTLARHELWAMQTPQAMQRDALVAAFDTCTLPMDRVTDDAQLLELAGRDVWLVDGEQRNLKITTPADLRIAEMIIADNDRAK